jgi:uncharacterized protein
MNLTRTERWILSNQYRILEKLYPDEAEALARNRDALEMGYELEYREACQHIYDDRDTMTIDECKEVIDILAMFSEIKTDFTSLTDKSGIDEWATKFIGFDGNDETKQMGYVRYIVEQGNRFETLDRGDNFNSHAPMLEPYRRMLREWNSSTNKMHLTKVDLIRITSAIRYSST